MKTQSTSRFDKLLKDALCAAYDCGDWNEKGENREPYDDYHKKSEAAEAALRAFVAPFLVQIGRCLEDAA